MRLRRNRRGRLTAFSLIGFVIITYLLFPPFQEMVDEALVELDINITGGVPIYKDSTNCTLTATCNQTDNKSKTYIDPTANYYKNEINETDTTGTFNTDELLDFDMDLDLE